MPIALLLQYKKVVVIFYTFNTVFQSFPAISTNNPLVSLIPTLFIILMGMGKELYLEYKRYKEDKIINQTECKVLTSLTEQSQLEFADS